MSGTGRKTPRKGTAKDAATRGDNASKSEPTGDAGAADAHGQAKAGPAMADYVMKDPEQFARNLARMIEQAGHVAAAWVAPREEGRRQDDIADSLSDFTKTLGKVSEYWLSDPERALTAQTHLFSRYLDLWNNSVRRMAGEEVEDIAKPEPGDRRFSDPEWTQNQFFDFLKQAYLLTSDWASELVTKTEGLDEHTKHKAIFYTQQLINSLSPSNFPATNPEVLRETFSSDGENLVRGMKMLAEDIASGD
ncbi:MAG: hypothetical protein VYD64_08990, partial [Pseudomonadota bacterium]|nr:hypothetical protein [Pseudomonadota bacterium]